MRKILCAILILIMFTSPSMAMTDEQESKCHLIIHTHAAAAAGSAAVLSQLPGADNAALAVIIGAMAIELAEVFNVSADNEASSAVGVAVLAMFGGIVTARFASQWLVGWIPFVGNTVNSASMFALVESIGWALVYKYDSGDFETLKPEQ